MHNIIQINIAEVLTACLLIKVVLMELADTRKCVSSQSAENYTLDLKL